MTAKIKKWGNSLGIRIPKDIANSINLTDDSEIEISIENGKIIITPKNNLLNDLVSKINNNNLHKEIEIKGIIGNEEW